MVSPGGDSKDFAISNVVAMLLNLFLLLVVVFHFVNLNFCDFFPVQTAINFFRQWMVIGFKNHSIVSGNIYRQLSFTITDELMTPCGWQGSHNR